MAVPEGHMDAAYLVRTIVAQQVTTIHFVPAMLQIFLEVDAVSSCTSLRRVICSGEALSAELRDRFFERLGCELYNLYGPTEAAVDVTYWECRRDNRECAVPIGYPVANTQIYVLDPQLDPMPIGLAGELHIGGVQVGMGYLGRPELTAEKFIPDPFDPQRHGRLYKTGDLARYRSDGAIEYLGRIDQQVKLRGFRIELGEIESLLAAENAVREVVVIVRQDRPDYAELVAYVVPHTEQAGLDSYLRERLRESLPSYMIPSAFVFLKQLPLTSSGKVDRRALPKPLRGQHASTHVPVASRDEIETNTRDTRRSVDSGTPHQSSRTAGPLFPISPLGTGDQRVLSPAMQTASATDVKPPSPNRVMLAATFTVDPLVEPLGFWLEFLGLDATLEVAPYHQVFQQLLDPTSHLRRNPGLFNVVWIRWDDLVPVATTLESAWLAAVREAASDLAPAIEAAAAASRIPWMIVVGPGTRAPSALGEIESSFVATLSQSAVASNIHVLYHSQVFAQYPVAAWYDGNAERIGHVPYTPAAFTATATAIARKFTSMKGSARKVIVLDCDNTLWAGVCGEDGPLGVRVDPQFRELQQLMREQKDLGRLLCLASKNHEADVRATFEQNSGMLLSLDDIVATRINWASKADNLSELAGELNLGLDSFVFLDDNPVECAEMRARHPQVLTLQIPQNAADMKPFLDSVWAFDVGRVTDADRERTASYQQAAKRDAALKAAPTFAQFLDGLALKIDVRLAIPAEVSRVAQLTQRTNQFNTTTLRLNEADVHAWLQHPNRLLVVVHVSDRFGDYGLVGAMFMDTAGGALQVTAILLSCRALGRGVEHRMVAFAGERARRTSSTSVELFFRETERNLPARCFLDSLEAQKSHRDDGVLVYALEPTSAANLLFVPSSIPESVPKETSTTSKTAAWPEARVLADISASLRTVDDVSAALSRRVRPRPDIAQPFVPPREQLEQTLASIWCEVLRLREVGTRDRFSDLGGTSIQLVRVHSLLVDRVGVQVSLTTMFEHPTILALAAALKSHTQSRLEGVNARAAQARGALRMQPRPERPVTGKGNSRG
jgi:FkbH-like protein